MKYQVILYRYDADEKKWTQYRELTLTSGNDVVAIVQGVVMMDSLLHWRYGVSIKPIVQAKKSTKKGNGK